MLNTFLHNILDQKSNIAKIYKIFCLSNINNEKALNEAAEMAFEYEFGTTDFYENDLYFDSWWLLIKNIEAFWIFLLQNII